jgi:hypothetical protein
MRLKAKGHLESQKKVTGDKLAARLFSLKEKGLAGTAIQRDTVIKKLKAGIRKTNYRLACIAAQEKLNADLAKTTAEKLAGKKSSPDKPSKKTAKGTPGKKEKKEKKQKKKAQSPASDDQGKEKKPQLPASDDQGKEKEAQPPASDEPEKDKKAQPPASDEQK